MLEDDRRARDIIIESLSVKVKEAEVKMKLMNKKMTKLTDSLKATRRLS